MRNKDTILLENAFEQVILKEDATSDFLRQLKSFFSNFITTVEVTIHDNQEDPYIQHNKIVKEAKRLSNIIDELSQNRVSKLMGEFPSGGSYEGGSDTNIGF